VKPAGHNTWRDDQPITVDEGSGTSTEHIIVIEVSVIVLHQNYSTSNVASLFQKGSPQLFTCLHVHPYLSAIRELVRLPYDIVIQFNWTPVIITSLLVSGCRYRGCRSWGQAGEVCRRGGPPDCSTA
jgi:hypothetical protein